MIIAGILISRKLDTSSMKGVYFANSLAFSLGFSTAIYGTFTNFGKNSRILGIRHTVRPTISISYSPDLSKGYYRTSSVYSGRKYIRILVASMEMYIVHLRREHLEGPVLV